MFCENCGKIIPDGAMFCPDCGNRLKEKPKRKKKPLKWILLLMVVIILAVAARTALKDWNYKTKYPAGYAMDKLVKSGAWNPSYTDDAAMNNYLQQMAFVCNGEDVYFQDNVNYYHLTDNDSIYYMPRYAMKDRDGNEIEEEGIQGIFINDILYSNTDGLMSYLDKDNNVNVWEMEYKVSDYHYNVASEILPYDNSLYFVYDGTLYRCMYKNITAQSVSIENGINWFSTDKEEVVFDEAEIRKFGIYADTIVMFGGDNSIWTLDISSGKAVCVLEGAKYRDQRCSVADGYIYYYFTDDSWNEKGSFNDNGKTDYIGRVKFDGTDNNPKYFALVSGDNVFNMSDSYIYYLQYNELYDEYFLIQTPIEDTTKQTVLATGEEHGLDEMVYSLYINDEWIYYVSTESGFWRAKIDGTLVEKLQEYNSEEKKEKNMIYPLKVEEHPSKFEIQQFTLSGNIDPDSVSGYCGDDSDPESVSWTLTDGVLTISGNGAMADFSSQDNQPWKQQRNHITSVIVDQGITSIGNESFAGLSNVTKVTLADTVTKIGDRAFINTKIETISFPSKLTSIGNMAFYDLPTLNGELHLPDGLVHVGEEAFAECSGLTGELHLPESMNTIGEGAFHGCGGLTGDLTIPGGIEYIDYSVFGGCTGLNGTLTLSEGVKNVEQNAFAGCQIQRIVLPDSLESITPTTFSQCDHVKEIVWNGTKKFDGYSYLPAIEEGTSDGDYNELESYEYEKGEYLSSLEIYEVNGIKSAYLGFWHNYGDSASDEDYIFDLEDGKTEYSVVGNRSGKNFLLDILPTDDGMRIKLIEKNQETQYSWPDGEATDAIIDEVYHKATS